MASIGSTRRARHTGTALATIGRIELAEGLPHPMLDGEWAKTARGATAAYLIVGFGEDSIDEAIDVGEGAGIRVVMVTGDHAATAGTIAERMVNRVPDVTRLVDRLERMGWVTRERGKEDRRVVYVHLAPAGQALLASLDDDDCESDYDFAKTEALPSNAFSSDVHSDETSEMPAVAGTDMDLDLDDLTAALQISGGGDTVEQLRDDATVEQPRPSIGDETTEVPTMSIGPDDMSDDLHEARTMTEVGTKLDLARAYVDMGDPAGARSILEEVLDEGDEGQRQQAQQLLDSLPG